jgi:hypothetical protein
MNDRQPLLSRNLLLYISIIMGAVDDAPFYRVYQYLHLLHIADGCIPPHFMQEWLNKQLALKHPF